MRTNDRSCAPTTTSVSAESEPAGRLVGVQDQPVPAEREGALADGLEEDAVDAVGAVEREELLLARVGGHDKRVDAAAADGLERLLGFLEPSVSSSSSSRSCSVALLRRRSPPADSS